MCLATTSLFVSGMLSDIFACSSPGKPEQAAGGEAPVDGGAAPAGVNSAVMRVVASGKFRAEDAVAEVEARAAADTARLVALTSGMIDYLERNRFPLNATDIEYSRGGFQIYTPLDLSGFIISIQLINSLPSCKRICPKDNVNSVAKKVQGSKGSLDIVVVSHNLAIRYMLELTVLPLEDFNAFIHKFAAKIGNSLTPKEMCLLAMEKTKSKQMPLTLSPRQSASAEDQAIISCLSMKVLWPVDSEKIIQSLTLNASIAEVLGQDAGVALSAEVGPAAVPRTTARLRAKTAKQLADNAEQSESSRVYLKSFAEDKEARDARRESNVLASFTNANPEKFALDVIKNVKTIGLQAAAAPPAELARALELALLAKATKDAAALARRARAEEAPYTFVRIGDVMKPTGTFMITLSSFAAQHLIDANAGKRFTCVDEAITFLGVLLRACKSPKSAVAKLAKFVVEKRLDELDAGTLVWEDLTAAARDYWNWLMMEKNSKNLQHGSLFCSYIFHKNLMNPSNMALVPESKIIDNLFRATLEVIGDSEFPFPKPDASTFASGALLVEFLKDAHDQAVSTLEEYMIPGDKEKETGGDWQNPKVEAVFRVISRMFLEGPKSCSSMKCFIETCALWMRLKANKDISHFLDVGVFKAMLCFEENQAVLIEAADNYLGPDVVTSPQRWFMLPQHLDKLSFPVRLDIPTESGESAAAEIAELGEAAAIPALGDAAAIPALGEAAAIALPVPVTDDASGNKRKRVTATASIAAIVEISAVAEEPRVSAAGRPVRSVKKPELYGTFFGKTVDLNK